MAKPAVIPAANRAPDEAALVEQARGGDMSALSRLLSRYQDRIVNTCWRLCGNLDDAQELAQEVFLQATRHIGKFQHRSGFYTWLFRIAVNLSISQRRRASRSPRLSLHTGDGEELPLARRDGHCEGQQDPSARLSAQEVHQRVLAELERLDDDHRSVLVLRDIEGMDYQQIAEVLELAVGTVKSRIHRARMEMRSRLREVIGVEE